MSNPLSNANTTDEQNINAEEETLDIAALFNASYSGDTEEVNRLQEKAANIPEVVEEETTPIEEEVNTEDGSDPSPTDNAEPVNSEPPVESTDELATLREQLHRAKSDAGRVPHLNRRVQELEKQLASLRTPATEPDTPVDLPEKLKAKLDKLREIDPDMADIVEETYRSNASATAEVARAHQTKIQLDAQRADEEYVRTEYNKVLAAIPEAEEVFRSPEWTKWVGMLSPNHRAMAESSDANEVITAIQAFKVDAENHFGGYRWGKATTPAPASTPQVSPTARAAENSRAARLANAASVKPTAARPTAELDMEEMFKAAYQKTLADNTRV